MKKFWKSLKKASFWKSDMGKGIQITLLSALILISWAIISASAETTYFGVSLSILSILRIGAILITVASIFAFLFLGIGEIPLLSPESKTKLTNLYDKTYMIIWIGATAIVSLQIYVFISNYIIKNFILKWDFEIWQTVSFGVFAILAYKIGKKYGFFREDS